MKMKYALRRLLLLLMVILLAALYGCGKEADDAADEKDTTKIQIYYLDRGETYLRPQDYDLGDKTGKAAVNAVQLALGAEPDDASEEKLLPDGVEIVNTELEEDKFRLTINFSASYAEMEKTREVLVRAGVVRTFCQIDGIRYVRFQVDGKEATDADGNQLNIMNNDSFVENAKQINAYKKTHVSLYFASADGKHLVKEMRSVRYNTSKPLAWAVVDRLIAGPQGKNAVASLPSSTSIISVTEADGICYVNLSQSFITDQSDMAAEVPIYSIVNSICDTCREVDKVQLSVEGNPRTYFRTDISLDQPFEEDMSLVETTSESESGTLSS